MCYVLVRIVIMVRIPLFALVQSFPIDQKLLSFVQQLINCFSLVADVMTRYIFFYGTIFVPNTVGVLERVWW